jgi:beta-N-acetylhexosaminidase
MALVIVACVLVIVVVSAGSSSSTTKPSAGPHAAASSSARGAGAASTTKEHRRTRRSHNHSREAHPAGGSASASPARLDISHAVGQLIIATYSGSAPSASILRAVRSGHVGAIILMGNNTTGGVARVRMATDELQAAAHAGGNPGLLIMTDQEGGEVKRLPGPPEYPASGMGEPSVAAAQGGATAEVLRSAGVNVDLAPVADVTRTDGFMTQEARTFGSSPSRVARSVCSFAHALAKLGVAYTLKHFPGLGDATIDTDSAPSSVTESAPELEADGAAYRRCGRGPLALVMVSSASYTSLTGATPAVLSPTIYRTVLPRDAVDALTISDSFESGAMAAAPSPALTAINVGLDMVMYPDYEVASATAYTRLIGDAESGALDLSRMRDAAARVLKLKRNLGVG